MTMPQPFRRAADSGAGRWIDDVTVTVRRGILLQDATTTMTALEYLAARDVSAAVIRRVLTRVERRSEDCFALDLARLAVPDMPPAP